MCRSPPGGAEVRASVQWAGKGGSSRQNLQDLVDCFKSRFLVLTSISLGRLLKAIAAGSWWVVLITFQFLQGRGGGN